MRNAIILHGTTDETEYYSPDEPSLSNAHWLPWLQNQLLIRGIAAATPEVPNSYAPDYAAWCTEVERYPIGPETILVGHSCGGGFWARWLSEHPEVRVDKVVLVAPWLDPDNVKQSDFFSFEIDPALAARTQGLVIFASDNDTADVQTSGGILRNRLEGAVYREFHNYGHFCIEDMGTQAFPELLAEILPTEVK